MVTSDPGTARLVYRVRDGAHVVFATELAELAVRRGVELVILAGPRRAVDSWLPAGAEGPEVDFLRSVVPAPQECEFYVCGPPAWAAQVRATLAECGVARRDVHREDFVW